MRRSGGVLMMLAVLSLIGCKEPQEPLWTQELPLVSKEYVYDEDDNLLEVFEYFYDEQNRYDQIIDTQYDIESGTGTVFRKYVYTYKKDKYYEDTIYPTHDNITTRNVYDERNNLIQGEYIFENKCHTATYEYEYKENQQICRCYGEGKHLVFTSVTNYNEQSDELSYWRDNNDGTTSSTTYQYKYDSDGNIIYMSERWEATNDAGSSYAETEYVYDKDGRLQFEYEKKMLNEGTGYMELESQTKVSYYYDEKGRLYKKIGEYEGEKFDNKYTIIYEY